MPRTELGSSRSAHRIDLDEFVRAREIDPVYCDRSYYLGVGAEGADAYRLLHDGLARAQRTGIGRWVFHSREYLVAVRPVDGVLALHTMRFADELVNARDLDLPKPSRAPSRREIEMAGKLVDTMHERFDPQAFKDTYRERVLALIEAKARGEEPELPEVEGTADTGELMAALEASLGSRRR
ncbi:MAG TPA: Ku protein [Solirubrobacteraceae bacterium]|nr:Ku protein [Solirubrobacteraceae bacterium]